MPKINKLASFEFSIENFLDACSPAELKEVDLLIQSNKYRLRMNEKLSKISIDEDEREEIKAHGFDPSFILDN